MASKKVEMYAKKRYELDEIKHFFEVYKALEPGKEVHGGEWVGHNAAEEEIQASYDRYKSNH